MHKLFSRVPSAVVILSGFLTGCAVDHEISETGTSHDEIRSKGACKGKDSGDRCTTSEGDDGRCLPNSGGSFLYCEDGAAGEVPDTVKKRARSCKGKNLGDSCDKDGTEGLCVVNSNEDTVYCHPLVRE